MAITIIEKGDPANAPTYTRTCPECKTKFSYKYDDTIDTNWLGGCRVVLCPVCGYRVAHLIAGGGDDINHPKAED